MRKPVQLDERPSSGMIEGELRRREQVSAAKKAIWGAIRTLLIFAAASVLISTLLLPVIRVEQNSMMPTISEGEIIIFVKVGSIGKGDIVAFHHNDQVLVKRVIATEGDKVDIDWQGVVSLNGTKLYEPYLNDGGTIECTVELPLQVQSNQFFLAGDNRGSSLDSRVREIGTIHRDRIMGRAVIRIWPLSKIGPP